MPKKIESYDGCFLLITTTTATTTQIRSRFLFDVVCFPQIQSCTAWCSPLSPSQPLLTLTLPLRRKKKHAKNFSIENFAPTKTPTEVLYVWAFCCGLKKEKGGPKHKEVTGSGVPWRGRGSRIGGFRRNSLCLCLLSVGRREKRPTPKTRFSIWTLLRTPGRFTTRPVPVHFTTKMSVVRPFSVLSRDEFGP